MTTIPVILKEFEIQRRASGYSKDTIERVVGNVNLYMSEKRVKSISRMTTESILEWGKYKLENNRRSSTVSTYYSSMRSFIKFARSIGINIDIDTKRLVCTPHYGKRTVLRPRQVRRVIKHCDNRTEILVRLMFTSGCRLSEALNIEREWLVGSDSSTLWVDAKGGQMRPLFITKKIKEELLELSDGREYCFYDDKGEHMNRGKGYYWIKKAMIQANVGFATPHSLRRTFVTTMLSRGADVSYVQRMAGHSSIATTQLYAQLMTDDIGRVHAKFHRYS